MKIVLQKFIADSGHCSRRQAESLIRANKVLVNGGSAELGMKVNKDDEVKIENKIIKPILEKVYIKLNKPVGYTCTNRKFKNEKNIFDLVNIKERLFSVGRLDKNSRGLVVLTNDGDWAQKLTHPGFEHEKEYVVHLRTVDYQLSVDKIINNFKQGIDIGEGDGVVRAKKAKKLADGRFNIVLTEGKKRQIRRMFKVLGLDVQDLFRIRIGNIELENLKEGEWKYFSI